MVPAFRPKSSMQAPLAAEYSQKCTPHPTPGTRSYSASAWPNSKLRWNSSRLWLCYAKRELFHRNLSRGLLVVICTDICHEMAGR